MNEINLRHLIAAVAAAGYSTCNASQPLDHDGDDDVTDGDDDEVDDSDDGDDVNWMSCARP